MMLDMPAVVAGQTETKTMFTLEIPSSLTKPYDIALTAVTQAEEFARYVHKTGDDATPSFMLAGLPCAIYTTPSGQLRYQVGIHGKPTRNSTHMMATLITAIRNEQAAVEKMSRRVPMQADVNYCEGHEVIVTLKGKRLLALDSGRGYNYYYHVGAIPRGMSGRKDYMGPMVPGPWAFANQCATVLTDSAAHRARDAAERADALKVDNGSKVWIDGVEYTVQVERGEFISLVPVDTSN
jgi:hypothetical protein